MDRIVKFKILIDGRRVEAQKGQSVLEVARAHNIYIPALCTHPDLDVKANCRLCLIEIEGQKGMKTSCSTPAEEGMEVVTTSKAIERARKINLELLYASHSEGCDDCPTAHNCELKQAAEKFGVDKKKYPDRKTDYPVYKFGPALVFDSSKCIDCRNCVEVCEKQGINFLEIKEKGHLFQVVPTKDKDKDCIYCGQCIVHCPVGAFESVGEYETITKPFEDKSKTVVVQFAPSIRASIGEEFDMPHGSVVTDQLVAGIKKLGVKWVFDTSVAADFTTVEEAKELVERIETKGVLPLFTSCCPAWVKYVEFNEPDFIPNLTTVKSPHVLSGGLIKTYWAEKEGIDPKDIVVVSIMPCVSKKYEIEREQMEVDGLKPVDYVLTTRELARLLHDNKIDLNKVLPEPADAAFGKPSGAGVIYGASGGVMESALRTGYQMITGKDLPALDLKDVRGLQGCKKATVDVGGMKLKVAVANGIRNAIALLEEIKKDPTAFHYVEVMACFGGCIGGGGQPIPTNNAIREKRAEALYDIDLGKKVRSAHKSEIVQKVYKEFLTDKEIIEKICHTGYRKRDKEVNF